MTLLSYAITYTIGFAVAFALGYVVGGWRSRQFDEWDVDDNDEPASGRSA